MVTRLFRSTKFETKAICKGNEQDDYYEEFINKEVVE